MTTYAQGHGYFKNFQPLAIVSPTHRDRDHSSSSGEGGGGSGGRRGGDKRFSEKEEWERERDWRREREMREATTRRVMGDLTIKDIEMLARAKKYKDDGYFIKDYDYSSPMDEVYHEVHRIDREVKKTDWVQGKTDTIVSRANIVEMALKKLSFIPFEAPDLKDKVKNALEQKKFFLEKQYEMAAPESHSYTDKELYMQLGAALIGRIKFKPPKEQNASGAPFREGFKANPSGTGGGGNGNEGNGGGGGGGGGGGKHPLLAVFEMIAPAIGIKINKQQHQPAAAAAPPPPNNGVSPSPPMITINSPHLTVSSACPPWSHAHVW